MISEMLRAALASVSSALPKTQEVSEIYQFTSQLPPTIDVKWGIGDNPEMGDKVKITVLASGFDMTLKEAGDSPVKKDDDEGIIFHANDKQPTGEEALKEKIKQIYVVCLEKWRMKSLVDRIRYSMLTFPFRR